MKSTTFSPSDVAHIAKLANIPITKDEEIKLANGFNITMKVVDALFTVDVNGVTPTNQVTGLENVLRVDVVDISRQFTQEQALMNAKNTYNGFFVVNQVIDQE